MYYKYAKSIPTPLTQPHLQVDFLPEFHTYGSLLAQFTVLNGFQRICLPFFSPELFLQCLQDYKVSSILKRKLMSYNLSGAFQFGVMKSILKSQVYSLLLIISHENI